MRASRHALMTMHAAARVPAHADALSDVETLGLRTQGCNATDDLVSEDRRVARDAPLVLQYREIRVTQSAVLDRDLNVLEAERVPRSTVSKVNDCLAAFATHALFTLTSRHVHCPLL